MQQLKVIHTETMCCGYKKCPTIKVFEDGSIEISDDDPDIGSTGCIKIRPEAVHRLEEILAKRK